MHNNTAIGQVYRIFRDLFDQGDDPDFLRDEALVKIVEKAQADLDAWAVTAPDVY